MGDTFLVGGKCGPKYQKMSPPPRFHCLMQPHAHAVAIELKDIQPNALHGVGHVEAGGVFVRRYV